MSDENHGGRFEGDVTLTLTPEERHLLAVILRAARKAAIEGDDSHPPYDELMAMRNLARINIIDTVESLLERITLTPDEDPSAG